MLRRLIVGTAACALGFGGFVVVALAPADAYSAPSAGFIDTIARPTETNGSVPSSVVDSNGNVFFIDSDNDVVQFVPKLSGSHYGRPMTADTTYTLAGTGTAGFSGEGGLGNSAQLDNPQGVAVDSIGDVFIADTGNEVVRVIPNTSGVYFGFPYTAGHIYTLVGTPGTIGYTGDGGAAQAATLYHPRRVAIDNAGNLLIADSDNNVIRVWSPLGDTRYGLTMAGNTIYTIAGNGSPGWSGDGGAATSATFSCPLGMTVDVAGDVIIADECNHRIRVLAESSTTKWGVTMTPGNIYTVAGSGYIGFDGDGVPATSAGLQFPEGAVVDGDGNLVIADWFNHHVRAVAESTGTFYGQSIAAGEIQTIAGDGTAADTGDGGPAYNAEVAYPESAVTDTDGNIIISASDSVRIITPGSPGNTNVSVSSSMSPDSLTPIKNASSEWTATVFNVGGTVQNNLQITFTIDKGTLNPNYFSLTRPGTCSFFGTQAAICHINSFPAGANADVKLQVVATDDMVGQTIHAHVDVATTPTHSTADSTISIHAPVAGTVVVFATGQKGDPKIQTDKKTSPVYATVIAKAKLAKSVAAFGPSFGGRGVHPADSGTLMTNQGSVIALQRVPRTSESYAGLCKVGSTVVCLGDIMTLNTFSNQTDPKHPAQLTLTFDRSVSVNSSGGNLSSRLFIVKTTNPLDPGVQLQSCIKNSTGYTNLPCIKKIKFPTTKAGYSYTVLILSGDPGFARK